jgi:hypothetical protein
MLFLAGKGKMGMAVTGSDLRAIIDAVNEIIDGRGLRP